MKEIYEIANSNQIPVHIDGARLFNAAEGAGVKVKDFAQYADTVQFCLSKGLGAPIGSIIAGSKEFIHTARKWRKMLGGGMRQAGVIAAPGLIALTKMKERLGEDHANARKLAEEIENIDGLHVENKVETNIVVVDVKELGVSSEEFVTHLYSEGVLAGGFGPTSVRFVTNFDVCATQLKDAIAAVSRAALKCK
jgi:threonine aldolase